MLGYAVKPLTQPTYLRIRVFCSSFTQVFQYFLPQRLWRDDLYFRAMFENVHNQFARVGVRDAQFIAAIRKQQALLLRMPVFIRHPTRAFGGEVQHGSVFGFAREDAVGTRVMCIKLFFRHVAAALWQYLGCDDAFDGEAAQGVAGMAVRVQIPVVAVVDEPLRGDFALAGLVVAAPVVADVQAVSLQQRARYGLEAFQRDIASGHAQDAHSFGDFFAAQVSGREDFFDAFFDGFELCIEQAGLNVCEQLLGGQQRIEFGFAEPESGEFECLPIGQRIVVAVA